jgi:serine phosphatase RsbU (regulator of sigma subunit)
MKLHEDGEFAWRNRGHVPPPLFAADGEVRALEANNLIVGLIPDATDPDY